MTIKVKYTSVDSQNGKWRSFKTLKGARKFAQRWVGVNPDMGSTYAVSFDGIGKIEVQGASLADLFGDDKPALTKDEEIFVARMLPHVAAGKSIEEAARAVLDDDRRIESEVFDNYSNEAGGVRDELIAYIYASLRKGLK